MKESTQVLLVSSFILPPSMFHININETCIYLAGSFAPPPSYCFPLLRSYCISVELDDSLQELYNSCKNVMHLTDVEQ